MTIKVIKSLKYAFGGIRVKYFKAGTELELGGEITQEFIDRFIKEGHFEESGVKKLKEKLSDKKLKLDFSNKSIDVKPAGEAVEEENNEPKSIDDMTELELRDYAKSLGFSLHHRLKNINKLKIDLKHKIEENS
ncbi:MAG TPA: hypothetical protein ENH85_00755 [Candidatus Scalindua sp.]|nr:hypothetical protein [Candidatus Scalindua sp.]